MSTQTSQKGHLKSPWIHLYLMSNSLSLLSTFVLQIALSNCECFTLTCVLTYTQPSKSCDGLRELRWGFRRNTTLWTQKSMKYIRVIYSAPQPKRVGCIDLDQICDWLFKTFVVVLSQNLRILAVWPKRKITIFTKPLLTILIRFFSNNSP